MTTTATTSPPIRLLLTLGMLTALGPLSIDLYLPAFPQLQREFGASDGAVQATLGGMTLGMAIGQLVAGAWSDRVGRRRPLLIAATLHLVATIGCALAPTVEVLTVLRVLQGFGAAGSAVLVLAIARDLADGDQLMQVVSRITVVTTTVPLAAPVAGALLLPLAGWRGVFAVLAASSAAMLAATIALVPETRPAAIDRTSIGSRLRAVLRDGRFRVATMVAAMIYAAVYTYVAASPLILQGVYDLSATEFALVFLANSIALFLGVQLAGRLARRWPTTSVLAAATAATLVIALTMVTTQTLGAGLPVLLVCLWLFMLACGGCFPGSTTLAIGNQRGQAGTATSVFGFITFAVATAVAPIAGLVGIRDALPLAVVLVTTSFVSVAGTILLLTTRETTDGTRP